MRNDELERQVPPRWVQPPAIHHSSFIVHHSTVAVLQAQTKEPHAARRVAIRPRPIQSHDSLLFRDLIERPRRRRRGTHVALLRSGKLIEVSGEAATFNRLTKISSGGQFNEESYSLGSDGVGSGRRLGVRGHDSE